MNSTNLYYFDVSWFSTKDGPGTRVVLFLQGCHLRCPWCHSPHSWKIPSSLLFFEEKCILCGACVRNCPKSVHQIINMQHNINRFLCIQCGTCLKNCPVSKTGTWNANALAFLNHRSSITELFQLLKPQLELLKKIGGLTVSGGEPLLQWQSLQRLLQMCIDEGIHTTVETSASLPQRNFEALIPVVNHWLIGVRPAPPNINKNNRVADIEKVTKNLELLCAHNSANITIRTPIIPGFTDDKSSFTQIASLMQTNRLTHLELLPYNPHAEHYYRVVGKEYELRKTILPNDEIFNILDFFTTQGLNASIIQ